MDHFICGFEIKSEPDNTRTFVGYGAAFGNIDSYGDSIAKGAFKDTLKESKSGAKAWPAMLSHHGGMTAEDQTPVGLWLDMEENDLRTQGNRAAGEYAARPRHLRVAEDEAASGIFGTLDRISREELYDP